jgi:hypothetical protein
MKSAIFAAIVYSALAEEGQKTVCLGPRAHLLTYKIEGEGNTLETADAADIEITRSADNDERCAGNDDDDALFCFGANTDETCSHAGEPLIFTDNFECTNCWAGITADLYYKISTTLGVPTRAEVGVRNTKILGALEVRAHGDAATELTSGSVDLFAPEVHVNFMAGSIPLNFTFSLPTRIDYNLGLKGELDALGGADLDVDFGDHGVAVSPKGFQWINTPFTTDLEPVFTVDTGDSGADMGLALAGSIHVEANDMVWYHVDFSAGLPSKIVLENDSTGLPAQLCFEGDVDVPVNQEAEVYKTVLGKKVTLYHYGPAEITHIHQDEALKKCTDLSAVVA